MIPARFEYEAARDLARAVELLARGGEVAKILAGGHAIANAVVDALSHLGFGTSTSRSRPGGSRPS
jgi:hypothetical protein